MAGVRDLTTRERAALRYAYPDIDPDTMRIRSMQPNRKARSARKAQRQKAHFSCKRSKICSGYETDIQENANAEIPDSSYAYLAGTGSQIYAGPKEIS